MKLSLFFSGILILTFAFFAVVDADESNHQRSQRHHLVTATAQPADCAVIHGGGVYKQGTQVTTFATDIAAGCDFVGWDNNYSSRLHGPFGCTGFCNACVFIIGADLSIIYRFNR